MRKVKNWANNINEGKMLLKSVFENFAVIPLKYTANGQNISPSLFVESIPEGTQSLVLIVDDPDAPKGTFVHWVVWNIAPTIRTISDGAPELNQMHVKQGDNDAGQRNYFGPKPPPGKPHRYFFKIYALDLPVLNLPEGSSKAEVEKEIQGHILEKAEIVGIYQHPD